MIGLAFFSAVVQVFAALDHFSILVGVLQAERMFPLRSFEMC